MWGEREEGLLAVERQTGETPKVLLNKPELHRWLEWYYEAFWTLDSSRPVYQGSLGRIHFSELAAYMSIFGIEEIEAKLLFIKTIRTLDSIYVKHVNAEIQRKIKAERRDAELERERHGR